MKDGKVRPEIVAKWAANSPLAMIDQYIPNLKTYRAIAMDIGTKDGLLGANKELELAMTRFGVVHAYEEYDGDHTNRRSERVETKVLPFFSNALSFTGTTTKLDIDQTLTDWQSRFVPRVQKKRHSTPRPRGRCEEPGGQYVRMKSALMNGRGRLRLLAFLGARRRQNVRHRVVPLAWHAYSKIL
jgi:hypothetical protein